LRKAASCSPVQALAAIPAARHAQAEFADILEQGRDEHVARLLRFQAQRLRQLARQLRHPPRMAGQLPPRILDQVGKYLDRHERGLQALGRLHLVVRLLRCCVRVATFASRLALSACSCTFWLAVSASRRRLLQRAPFQRAWHHQHDIVLVPRLGHVAVDFALVDGVEDGLDVRVARQQQAHGGGPALAHLGQELRAIHVRHAHVGNDQVHRLGSAGPGPRAARPSARGSRGAEQAAQRRQDVRSSSTHRMVAARRGAGARVVLFSHGAIRPAPGARAR
jgi:hypothetical protein